MWFASIGANHLWPLAWVAPVPLLAVVPDLRLRVAALAAFAAASLGALNLAFTYASALPAPLLVGLVLLTSVPYAAVVVAWHAVQRRTRPTFAALAYAALVVAAEFAMSAGSPNGTFGSFAYSQTDVLSIVQIASVTGLWGVTFLLSIVAAGVALAWRARGEAGRAIGPLTVAAVPLAAALAFGVFRLAEAAPSSHIRVGLAANDTALNSVDTDDPAIALPVVRAYAARAARLADGGAQVVVLPEKFVGVTRIYADEANAILSEAARAHQITLVAGLNLLPWPARSDYARNTAAVFGADGHPVLEYDKVHLVPGLESYYRPGRNIGLLPASEPRVGVAICKDLDFVALGRAYGNARVGLLLVPAWDFVRDDWLHSRMAIMRAIENGFALARTASEGRLTVADARGRVVAEAVSTDAPEVLVTASVAVAPGGTSTAARETGSPGCVELLRSPVD